MKRLLVVLALPVTLGLSACVTDGYYGGNAGVGLAYGDTYPYDGYYDGHYGPIYDGYWGSNGYFYYRGGERDRSFRRGDRNHFHRGPNAPRPGFNPMQGSFRPGQGMRVPHFPGGGGFRGGSRGGERPRR